MPLQLLRPVSYQSAVFSDGILVFAMESGATTLLPRAYWSILEHINTLPKGQCLSGEKVVSNEMCIDGSIAEETRQLLIDVGVVAVC